MNHLTPGITEEDIVADACEQARLEWEREDRDRYKLWRGMVWGFALAIPFWMLAALVAYLIGW